MVNRYPAAGGQVPKVRLKCSTVNDMFRCLQKIHGQLVGYKSPFTVCNLPVTKKNNGCKKVEYYVVA